MLSYILGLDIRLLNSTSLSNVDIFTSDQNLQACAGDSFSSAAKSIFVAFITTITNVKAKLEQKELDVQMSFYL